MLQQPSLASQVVIDNSLRSADIQGINVLFELFDMIQASPELSSAAILERWRDHEMGAFLNKLLHWHIPAVDDDNTSLIMLQQAIEKMLLEVKNQRLDALLHKSQQTSLDETETRELQFLMQRENNDLKDES